MRRACSSPRTTIARTSTGKLLDPRRERQRLAAERELIAADADHQPSAGPGNLRAQAVRPAGNARHLIQRPVVRTRAPGRVGRAQVECAASTGPDRARDTLETGERHTRGAAAPLPSRRSTSSCAGALLIGCACASVHTAVSDTITATAYAQPRPREIAPRLRIHRAASMARRSSHAPVNSRRPDKGIAEEEQARDLLPFPP